MNLANSSCLWSLVQLHHKIGKKIPGSGLIQIWCSLAKYNLSNRQEIRLRGAHMMMQLGSLTTQIHDLAKKLDSPFAEPSAYLNSIGYTNLCKEYQIALSATDRQGIQNSREYWCLLPSQMSCHSRHKQLCLSWSRTVHLWFPTFSSNRWDKAPYQASYGITYSIAWMKCSNECLLDMDSGKIWKLTCIISHSDVPQLPNEVWSDIIQ